MRWRAVVGDRRHQTHRPGCRRMSGQTVTAWTGSGHAETGAAQQQQTTKQNKTNKMSRKARRGEGKEKSQAQEAARRKQLNTRVMTMNKYETGAVGKCKGKRKEEEVEWQTNTVNTGGGVNAPLVAVRAHHHHRQNVRPSLSQR